MYLKSKLKTKNFKKTTTIKPKTMQEYNYIEEILESVLKTKKNTVQKRNSIISPEREAKMHAEIDRLIERRRSSAKIEEQKALKKYQEVHLKNGMRMDSKFLMKTNESIMEYVNKMYRWKSAQKYKNKTESR